MAINFNEAITIDNNVIKEIEQQVWKVKAFDPESKYNEDKESPIGIMPEFEVKNGRNVPIKGTLQYYQIRLVATHDSQLIFEDDELILTTEDLSLIEDLERKDKVKVKLAADKTEFRVRKFTVEPRLVLADVKVVNNSVGSE